MKIEEKENIYNCIVIPNGDWEGFKVVANSIRTQLKINFKQKVNDVDSYYWSFDFQGIEVNLHYHEMIGDVELFVNKDKSNDIKLGVLLEDLKNDLK